MGDNLWTASRDWLWRSAEVIAESAPALNSLNVFPVSDADTGSNISLTLNGIAEAVGDFSAAKLDTMVQAAILSAHGNSGAIVAEMVVSACRSLQRASESSAASRRSPAQSLARVLRTVSDAATEAVAEPVAGTILTVAEAAATGAERAATASDSPLEVARAAQSAAREALSHTPEQLAVLSAAGVVDAGGQALVLLLDVLVEVLGGPEAVPLLEVATIRPNDSADHATEDQYEVMYALTGADSTARTGLRRRLNDLGESVVIVGDEDLTQVHVHLGNPGAAVEAGLELGRLSQIRIVSLAGPQPSIDPQAEQLRVNRTVIAVVTGPGLAAALTSLGALTLELGDGVDHATALERAVAGLTGDVVLLPNDRDLLTTVERLARSMRGVGRRIAVIPTVAQVQGLAAMAVHEPESDFDTAVVAMSTAAGHARHGAVTSVSRHDAEPADGSFGRVIGTVNGDPVEQGTGIASVAHAVVDRMLSAGGELLTVVTGVDCPAGLADEVVERARQRLPGLEADVIAGGQPHHALLVGVE